MAYTYNDFLKAASGKSMLERFDPNDLEITKTSPEYGLSMLRLMQDQDKAVSPEARLLAGEAISQLRTNYSAVPTGIGSIKEATNLTDGSVGTDPLPPELPEVENPPTEPDTPDTGASQTGTQGPGNFVYDKESQYQQLLRNITNPTGFHYDYENDPVFKALRKDYLREGERAAQNALTRAAAATGGIPSSYAVTAAQQAGANYAEGLVGMIPTLEQNAYDRYLNNRNLQLTALQALEADRADAYGKHMDEYQMLMEQINPGQSSTGSGESTGYIPLDEIDLEYLKEAYPSGRITDKAFWEDMVATHGEAALKAAGYYYWGDGLKAWLERIGGKISDSPIGSIFDNIKGGD